MSPHDHRPTWLGRVARASSSPRRDSSGAWVAVVVLATAIGLIVAVPVLVTARQVASRITANSSESWAAARSAFSLQAFANTGVYALLIALVAVVLAWPAAWMLASARSARVAGARDWRSSIRAVAPALIATPLLLPSYLTYAGWGLLRGPNTRFGDWLARQDPGLTVWVGKATAVAGMALWVWPLAAFVLAGFVRASSAGLVEIASLDAPSNWRRNWMLLVSARSGIAAAAGTVALVMLGSAIPLHVAQVPTFAIELWRVMQLTPDTTGVWIASTPLIAIAGAMSLVLTWQVSRWHERPPESAPAASRGGRAVAIGTSLVWTATVLVPLALFLWSLGSWRSIPQFWRFSGAGVAQSLRLAAAVGAVAVSLIICTWAAIDVGGRVGRAAAACALAALLFTGISPGVLVGTAVAGSWGRVPELGATIVVLAHLARFGFLAVLAGWWLSRVQGREQRWLVELDGGRSLAAWLAGSVRPLLPSVAGVALAMGALSLHEIESTIFVLPPGVANLPQQLLDYLHYARDEQLSAAAVNLLGLGIVGAFFAAALVLRAGGRNLQRRGPATGSLD